MNKKAVQWLYRELPELEARGVLTPEISGKIRRHYDEAMTSGKTMLTLMICGILGALLIGLGIILLIAHNWEQLSRFSRAVLSLLPLLIGQGLALWVLRTKPQSGAFKEGTATFLSLMVAASIALISQTYHIPGDAGTFILTWMALIVPLVYLMQASLPAAIYLIGITVWSSHYWNDPLKGFLFWPLAAVVVPHFIWTLRQEAYAIRSALISLIMIICISLGLGFSVGRTWPGSWVIVFPSIFAVFYALGSFEFDSLTTNWQRSLRGLGGLALIVLAFQFTFRDLWKYLSGDVYAGVGETSGWGVVPDYAIIFAIVAMAMFFLLKTLKRGSLTDSLFLALPLLAILGYLLHGQAVVLLLLIFNAYLLSLGISHIMAGIRSNNLPIVNGGMLIVAILIIVRFFDSDINFILKGLTFIIVGIGFLVTNLWLVSERRCHEK
jgi:uncharacterized membrane protein